MPTKGEERWLDGRFARRPERMICSRQLRCARARWFASSACSQQAWAPFDRRPASCPLLRPDQSQRSIWLQFAQHANLRSQSAVIRLALWCHRSEARCVVPRVPPMAAQAFISAEGRELRCDSCSARFNSQTLRLTLLSQIRGNARHLLWCESDGPPPRGGWRQSLSA